MEQGDPGKSLIREVETLRDAVLKLCELQKEFYQEVRQALNRNNPIGDGGSVCMKSSLPPFLFNNAVEHQQRTDQEKEPHSNVFG